ncbi:hydrogenase maturation protease [Desulfovibrio aminophilus]|nr:hydrogenase maturation protease [Desulfovibrio aminophilus]MCM0755803.1 hydrogenase maturation protease [Desulfovibrio aminophilus]
MDGGILVMGAGNPLMRDDGAGVLAVRALMAESWPEGVEFEDAGTFTQDFFHLLDRYSGVLILDVARFGGAPGEVRVLDGKDILAGSGPRVSLHELDLAESLRLARELGAPPRLRLVVMEPGDTGFGLEPTPEIRAALPRMIEAARGELRRLLDAGQP